MTLRSSKGTKPLRAISGGNLSPSESGVRARAVREAKRGNTNSLRHGVFARVALEVDVAVEVALTFTIRPTLDPLADFRLVEDLAVVRVRHRRALEAINAEGPTANLTKWESNLGASSERLERAVHERAAQRAKETAQATARPDLTAYRPTARGGAS